MQKYLWILGLGLLLLWGGLAATTLGGNSLLGRQAIPQALTVAWGGANYRIVFMGKRVQVGRALILGELSGDGGLLLGKIGFSPKYKVPLLQLDQLIVRRNRYLEHLWGRKRGGNVE